MLLKVLCVRVVTSGWGVWFIYSAVVGRSQEKLSLSRSFPLRSSFLIQEKRRTKTTVSREQKKTFVFSAVREAFPGKRQSRATRRDVGESKSNETAKKANAMPQAKFSA